VSEPSFERIIDVETREDYAVLDILVNVTFPQRSPETTTSFGGRESLDFSFGDQLWVGMFGTVC
jgi:hypothetical protein